jgi:hypothetical protein
MYDDLMLKQHILKISKGDMQRSPDNENDVSYDTFGDEITKILKYLEEKDKIEGNVRFSLTNSKVSRLDVAMSTRISFRLRKAELRDSCIHGKGVFATIDMKKGDIVTFYPPDFLERVYPAENKTGLTRVSYASTLIIEKFGKHFTRIDDTSFLDDYAFDFPDSNYSVCGHPGLVDDPSYLGHMLNDAAKPTSDEKSFDVYEKVSLAKMNCVIEVIHNFLVVVRAAQDIKAGEELLVCYGRNFWKSKMMREKKIGTN